MFMCDVLQERDAQVEIKKMRAQQEQAIDEGWVENDKVKMEDYDQRMNTRMEEMFKRKQETAKVISQQLVESKQAFVKRIKEERLEGELVKRKAHTEIEIERRKENDRRNKQLKNRDDLNKANEQLKVYNGELKKKEKEEEKKQKEYAVQKERLDQLKKDREEQRFLEAQRVRERLIQQQAEYLSNLKNREDQILNKQVGEAEEKARLIFEEKELKIK